MGGGDGREKNALKTAVVVVGGLGLAWLTMETAFKPFLDRVRTSMAKSDPTRDPDSLSSEADDGPEARKPDNVDEDHPRLTTKEDNITRLS